MPTFDSPEAVNELNVLSFKSWWFEDKEEETLGNNESAVLPYTLYVPIKVKRTYYCLFIRVAV